MDDSLKRDAVQLLRMLLPQARESLKQLADRPLTAPMGRYYRLFDELVAASPEAVACQPGCDMCCHYHVMVSVPEALALAEAIEKLPPADRQAITARVVDHAQRIAGMSDAEHAAARISCALLRDGRCLVYAARPMPCRRHHSTNVDACRKNHEDHAADVPIPLVYSRRVAALATETAQVMALQEQELEADRYELHAALAELLQGGAGRKRWKNGKAAFPNQRHKAPAVS